MLSVWNWMDGWKITEILYAALSWNLSKQMWFLARHDMILAELHPKIHGSIAGLSCMPASALLRGLFRVFHGMDLMHPGDWCIHQGPPGCQDLYPTCDTSGKVMRGLFLTSLWFLSWSFWGSEPSSACQLFYFNLFFYGLTALPFPQTCCVDN